MAAEVVGIHGGADPRKPDHEVCQVLQGLLERAFAGELKAIAYVTVDAGGGLGTGWSGRAGTRYPLAAGISVLAQRYTVGLREKEAP